MRYIYKSGYCGYGDYCPIRLGLSFSILVLHTKVYDRYVMLISRILTLDCRVLSAFSLL